MPKNIPPNEMIGSSLYKWTCAYVDQDPLFILYQLCQASNHTAMDITKKRLSNAVIWNLTHDEGWFNRADFESIRNGLSLNKRGYIEE